jgi:hypothetical protein
MGVSGESELGVSRAPAAPLSESSLLGGGSARSSGIPGKSTRTGASAPAGAFSPESDKAQREEAARDALEQAHKALALLEQETSRLEAAFSVRDVAATRASADAARALQRSLRGALGRAGAGAGNRAEAELISRRADELDQRLLPVLRQTPPMPLDLGINLIDPMNGADDEAGSSKAAASHGASPDASKSASPDEDSGAPASEGPVTDAPDGSLPDGVDYQWIPGTFRVRLRKAWVLSAIHGPLGRSAIPPVRLREILRHLRAVGALHWASDAAIDLTADELTIHSLARGKVMELALPVQAFQTLGLPSGVRTMIDLDGSGGLVAVMPLPPPVPPAAESAQLSAAQRRQLVLAIEDFFGVPMDAPSRDTFLHKTGIACKLRSGAISLHFSRAELEWLFSAPMYEAVMEAGVAGAGSSWQKLAAAPAGHAGPPDLRKKSGGRGKKPAVAKVARPSPATKPALEEEDTEAQGVSAPASPTATEAAFAASTAEQSPTSSTGPASSTTASTTTTATSEAAASPSAAADTSASSTSPTSTEASASASATPRAPTSGLSADEKTSVREWLAQHLASGEESAKPATTDDTPRAAPSRYLLDQIRVIDAHPQRSLVFERLRATTGGAKSGEPLTGRALAELILWAEHEAARRVAGLAEQLPEDASAGARPPVFDFPVSAVLLHNAAMEAPSAGANPTGYATATAIAGEELRFWLNVDWPQTMSGAQHQEHIFRDRVAECEWVFQRCGATGASSGAGARFVARSRGREPSHRQRFELDPGSGASEETWTLQAFVRHSYFRPAQLTLTFQVRSERRHFEKQRGEHFADLGGIAATQDESFGEGSYDHGRLFAGELPDDFQRRTPAERRQQHEQEIARLTEMRAYLAREARYPDAIAACDRQLAALRDTIADLADDDRQGWKPFEGRAFFVGEGEHSLDGPLHLACSTKPGETPAGIPAVAVQVRDLSRRLSASDYCFTATGETFEQALKRAFYDLAKKYPRGKVSLLAERATDHAEHGQTIGFELDTGTDWEDLREEVFDPMVSAAINIGAAVVMIFAPATIPVLMPLTIAYNSSQTVDQMADAWTSGTLTPGQGALSLAEIGLNLLPLVGRVPIIQTSKLAFAMYQLGDAAGQALVMTLQAQQQIAALRDQDIAQMASSYAELVELQKSAHPSDPRVAKKRAALELRAQALRDRTLEVWSDLVKQQAIAMAPVRLAGHLEHHLTTSRLASLRAQDLLVDRPGETPHYDPQSGKILGDARQLDLDTSTRLLAERDAHQSALAGELAGDLGLPRDRVAIQPGPELKLEPDGDGFIATLPPDTSPTDAMRAWRDQATSLRGPKPIILGGDDLRMRSGANIPPREGYVDVYIHSDGDTMEINFFDRDVVLSARELAGYLRSQGLEGQNIRLVACKSGTRTLSIAQDLANALKATVLAPTNNVWTSNGDHGIGEKFGEKTGEWVPFEPIVKAKLEGYKFEGYRRHAEERKEAKKKRRAEIDQDSDETKQDTDDPAPPESVHQPHFDRRETVHIASPEKMAEVQQALGTKVVVHESMSDGVQVAARRVRRAIGFDLEVIEVRVGPRTTLEDILVHRAVVAEIQRYNGVLGKLRRLVDAAKDIGKKRRFPHGSIGWRTELELSKLDELLSARKGLLLGDVLEHSALKAEIQFLEGRQIHHQSALRSIEETAEFFDIERPDTGAVTREALGKGYRLPGPDESANPDWYYYRNSALSPGVYELVRKPEAPYDAPALSARVVGDDFMGFTPIGARPSSEIPHDATPQKVITDLRATKGFSEYSAMLDAHGLASPAVVDGVIQTVLNRRRMSARAEVTYETVRHEVKEHFRERLHAYLCYPALDDSSSWARLRSMVARLGSADRGALAETWYRNRHRLKAKPHVPVYVERTSGINLGSAERRVVDLVDGKTAIEVKDTTGPIDREQFGAYLDMLKKSDDGDESSFLKLQYVFTNPKGAISNLEFLSREMGSFDLRGKLSVVAFDSRGRRHVASSPDEVLKLHARLKEENAQ